MDTGYALDLMTVVDILGRHPFRQITAVLGDGRCLTGAEYGRPTGCPPIIYFHGFLGSRLEPRVVVDFPLHLLAFDRPGYGGSSPPALPSLRTAAQDVVEVLDALGIAAVGAIGMSAGGPYAASFAAELGPRMTRLALVGAVGDMEAIRAAGGAVRLFHLLRRVRGSVSALAPCLFRLLRRYDLERPLIGLLLRGERHLLAPEVDRQRLEAMIVASVREGTRPGLEGAIADMALLTRYWELSPRQINCPTLILHGALDRVVPPAHAKWYGSQIQGALVEIEPRAAHVSIAVNGTSRVVRWFARED